MTASKDPSRNSGDELRKALAPLASDPMLDAQRVLARIRADEAEASETGTQKAEAGPRRGKRTGGQPGKPSPILQWTRQIAWPAAWAAAGFLFGLLILQGQQDDGSLPIEMSEGPHMVLAQGQVFLDQDQQRRLLPVGATIPDGSRIETSKEGSCLVSLRDGSVVLLDKNTRIRVIGASELDLETGRILARVRRGKDQRDLIVTGKGSAATRLLQSEKQPWGESIFIKQGNRFEILSIKGLASVQAQSGEKLRLGPRRRAVLQAGEERENELVPYVSHRLAWADLYLDFLPKPEWKIQLEKELPSLLLLLGNEKSWMEVDLKIRHLGATSIDPLFSVLEKYKASEESIDIQKRLHAAGLVSNLATLRDVDRLFHYLMDDSPRVRTSMFFGLERLIGSFYSEESEKGIVWAEGSKEERLKELKLWKAWWTKTE